MQTAIPFKQLNKSRTNISRLPEWMSATVVCIIISLAIVVSTELRGIYRIALLGGIFGSVFLVSFPQRRILLVIAWILIHPLSIEKVFLVGEPLLETFFPPTIVVSASDVMLIALFTVVMLESLFQRKLLWQWPDAMTPYLILTVWAMAVYFLRGPDTTSSLTIVHMWKMIFFMIVLVSSVRKPGELKLVIYAICIAILVQVMIVGLSFFTKDLISVSSKVSGDLMSFSGSQGASHVRATGTVGHVNQEASFITFFGLPLIAMLFAPGKPLKLLGLLSLAGGMASIGLTFSRSAWASVAFAILIMVGLGINKRELKFRHWIYAMPVLLMIIASLPVVSQPIIDRVLHGDDGATSSRVRAMRLSYDLFSYHPISGVGPGNFSRASLQYYPPERKTVEWLKPREEEREITNEYGRLEISQVQVKDELYAVPLPVHNKFLLVMTELGIIGLLIFLWFQYRIYRHIKSSLQSNDNMFKWLSIGIAGAFAASLCYMNLDLFTDDKTMEILLIIPVLAMITDQISKFDINADTQSRSQSE